MTSVIGLRDEYAPGGDAGAEFKMESGMKYILMDYVNESGWPTIPREEQERWLGAYKAYMQAMADAGVLKSTGGLRPTSTATTVRVKNEKTQVLDEPDCFGRLGAVERAGRDHVLRRRLEQHRSTIDILPPAA